MNTFNDTFSLPAMRAVIALIAVLLTSACSDDGRDKTTARSGTVVTKPFDHAHGREVTDLEKHKFEHKFADQCIEREMARATDKAAAKARFAEPCMCIARLMMKDLTAKEAQKFLREHKNTQSLQIRYENAAYHCLQERSAAKPPSIFRRR
jgi:hypothetical protein